MNAEIADQREVKLIKIVRAATRDIYGTTGTRPHGSVEAITQAVWDAFEAGCAAVARNQGIEGDDLVLAVLEAHQRNMEL